MPGKALGLSITAGLVAVAAIVGGAIWYTSGKASEVNLTTAKLVPEDAGFYVALNTDLSSSQWVAAFNLAERLGQEDPEEELKDTADDADIDWEDDVAPFLGGNAALFVRGLDINDFNAQGAIILKCNDAKAALDVIDDQAGLGDDDEYQGVEYYEVAQGGFVAVIDEHLVIAFDEESLEAVIDVHRGKTKSLASREDFQRLRDELTRNFLGFVYINAEDMLGDFFLDDPVIKAAIEDSGSGDLVFKPAAWVLGATKDGFEFQAASLGEAGAVSPMVAPRESKLIKYAPADAALFFSTVNIAETWDKVMKDARPAIDDAIREEGEFRSLDDALEHAGKEAGIDSLEDVIELLKGETAVAAWFPSGDEDEPAWALLAEVDESTARGLLEGIVKANSTKPPRTEKVNGHDMTVFEPKDDDEDGAYAFLDGNLVLGTREAVSRVLSNTEPPLGELRKYRDTVKQMPTALGTYGYFDLSKLLRLAQGGIPADLDEAEKALSGLIINAVDERGVVRLSGILTVEE